MLLAGIGDYKPDDSGKPNKFSAFKDYIQNDYTKEKECDTGKYHLYLYVNDDMSLEEMSDKNICVRAFSPTKNTLFDILDCVFDLRTWILPRGIIGERIFFRVFEEKTERIRVKKHIESPASHVQKIASILDKNSLFIYGPYGSGKSYLAIQVARYMIWNRKKYAPIWIKISSENILEIGFSSEENSDNFLPGEIKNELLASFREKDEPMDEKNCLGKLYQNQFLIIIEGINLAGQQLNNFLDRMEIFRMSIEKTGSRIIFINTAKHDNKWLENLAVFEMRLFETEAEGKDSVVSFLHETSRNEKYYERNISVMKAAHTYDNVMSDLEHIENLVYRNYGKYAYRVEWIGKKLFSSSSYDYRNIVKSIETGNEKDITKAVAVHYKEIFESMDLKYDDDAQWVLLYLLNYNYDEYVSLETMKKDIDERIGKKDMEAVERLNNIFSGKEEEICKMLDKLVNIGFINPVNIEKPGTKSIQIIDKTMYDVLFFEDCFSAKGLRERLVVKKHMLKECIIHFSADENLTEKQKGTFEFILGLFENLHEIKYEFGSNIFHGIARFCPHIEIFELLFDKDPNLFYYTDENGKNKPVIDNDNLRQTAFHYAAAGNQKPEILEWLLSKAEECGLIGYLDLETKNKNIALHYAAEFNRNADILKFFLKDELITEMINYQNKDGLTPLLYSCWRGTNPEITELLIKPFRTGLGKEVKSDLSIKTDFKQNPVHLCVYKPANMKVVEQKIDIIKKYAEDKLFSEFLEQKDTLGRTPFLNAVAWVTNLDVLRKLTPSSDTLNDGLNGYTPLHAVVRYSTPEVAEFLVLEKGANINKPDIKGQTPLHYAVRSEKKDVEKYKMVRKLRELEANRDESDNQGLTPLHWAIDLGQEPELIKLLVTEKNINAKANDDFFGATPLLLALNLGKSIKPNKEVVSELIKYGANVKIADIYGNMPLYYAKTCGDPEIIDIIVKAEAKF